MHELERERHSQHDEKDEKRFGQASARRGSKTFVQATFLRMVPGSGGPH